MYKNITRTKTKTEHILKHIPIDTKIHRHRNSCKGHKNARYYKTVLDHEYVGHEYIMLVGTSRPNYKQH